MTFPQFKDGKVCATWRQAGHDVQTATSLLLDPSFSYQPLPFPAPKALLLVMSPVTGHIRELKDAQQAECAAAKEKGKKSMIYAAWTDLTPQNSMPPFGQQSTEDTSQQSPTLPIVALRHLK